MIRRRMTQRRYRLLLVALFACTTSTLATRANAHGQEIVPEFNAFIKLSDRTRLYLLGDVTHSNPGNDTEVEVGAHLDYTLMPILRPQLQEANWVRERYLWMRVGYLVLGKGDSGDFGRTERRGIIELTGRVPLPLEVWLVNRARVDLRELGDEFSQRYRFRIVVEREFTVGGVAVVPYAQGEIFYDTRYDAWNREVYQTGVEVELSKAWRIEPYIARQNDSRSASGNVDRFGLVLKYYR
jgi:hypothetical protein